MHHADRDRDGDPDCPYDRADRLGDGGPSAAGIARDASCSAGMRFGPLAKAIGRSNMAKKAKKSKAKAKKAKKTKKVVAAKKKKEAAQKDKARQGKPKAAAAAPAAAPAATPAMPSWMTPGSGSGNGS